MPPIQNPDPIQLVSPVVMGSAAFGAFGGASHRSSTWGNALAKLLLLLVVVVCWCLLVFVVVGCSCLCLCVWNIWRDVKLLTCSWLVFAWGSNLSLVFNLISNKGDTEPDQLCVPASVCQFYHLSEWQPAKPSTGMSFFQQFFKPNLNFTCMVFAI